MRHDDSDDKPLALSPLYIMNKHWWDIAWPNFSRWFRIYRRQSPIQVSFDDILGWRPHTWKSVYVGHHHKMLMFMEFRQYNGSRSLITPSICYDNCSVYSDLLLHTSSTPSWSFTSIIRPLTSWDFVGKALIAVILLSPATPKGTPRDGYWCYEPKAPQFYAEDTPITRHNTRVGIFWWASQMTQNQ